MLQCNHWALGVALSHRREFIDIKDSSMHHNFLNNIYQKRNIVFPKKILNSKLSFNNANVKYGLFHTSYSSETFKLAIMYNMATPYRIFNAILYCNPYVTWI